MQGKSGSSLSAIDEAEKAFFETMKGKVSAFAEMSGVAIASGDLRSGVLSRVEACMRVFESVFLISQYGEANTVLIRYCECELNFAELIDALTINFEYS